MSIRPPRKIETYAELDSVLGTRFIILCGSAISGGLIDEHNTIVSFLPMVSYATEKLFSYLYMSVRSGDYLDRLLSQYSLALVNGKYQSARLRTKFEDFLWRLESALGANKVAELLRALYLCEKGQYLHTHAAISNLMIQGRVKLCLTTNFDNAIELANPDLDVLVHTRGFSLQHPPSRPTILKLHGDVIKGSYIATIPEMIAAEKTATFSYLEDLLGSRTILVAGYSGYGDIDIAPYIRVAKQNGARLVWLVKPGSQPPDLPTDWYSTDLFSVESERNCLLELSGKEKMLLPDIADFPEWEKRLENWIGSLNTSEDVMRIIEETLNGVAGWARFHIYFVKKWETEKSGKKVNKDLDLFSFVKLCQGIGSYYSVLRAIRKIDRDKIRKLGLFRELLFWEGFTNWRLVRLEEASNILRHFCRPSFSDANTVMDETGLRVYLEVVRDMLSSMTSAASIWNHHFDHQIDEACTLLLSSVKNSVAPSNEILSRLVVMDINRIIGRDVQIVDYHILYQRAFDLHLWLPAKTAAQSMLRMDIREGFASLRNLFRATGGAWKWHSIKHNTLALLDRIPKRIVSISYLANVFLSRIPVFLRELQFATKKIIWRFSYIQSIISIE